MKILAVDHGDVHIGLAICDASGIVARPLPEYLHVSRDQDAAAVALTARQAGAGTILLGAPTNSVGERGTENRKIRRFAATLKKHTSIPVKLWDESDTSVRAASLTRRRTARRKRKTYSAHSIAAAVILQDYLDSHAFSRDTPKKT